MAKSLALHIGLNSVDPGHYSGWDGPLMACEADAEDMQKLSGNLGYESTLLLTRDATRPKVIAALKSAANRLAEGDIFLLTYSGHGGQVPDLQEEEVDGMDETWCLFDGQIVDDELWQHYSAFADGVRIFIVSDSCHSGTVARDAYIVLGREGLLRGSRLSADDGLAPRYRTMPMDVALKVYRDNPDFYIPLLEGLPADGNHLELQADVRLLSGCQDNQLSLDGTFNGLFTGTLLKVWKNGLFGGNYRDFHRAIVQRMPATQTPNHVRYGRNSPVFDAQKPFEI